MIAACIGAVSLAIWIYLVLARGGFWRMQVDDQALPPTSLPIRKVAAIVPARNEAQTVGQAIRSLLRQDYAGSLHIFLVDDHSSDDTAEVARRAAEDTGHSDCLTIVEAAPLPRGWTGKLWALSEGLKAAESFSADYYWFTDADILHQPDNLAGLVVRAEAGGFDLVSLMVKLRCESFAERMLIPAFVFFFFKLYPPAWVTRADKPTAAAAGGCILIRPSALTRIGSIAAIRNQLIDDCAIARAVKCGGPIWLGPTSNAESLRAYHSFREIGRMIARSAFTQLRHSALLLCGVVMAMTITYIAPPCLLGMRNWAASFGLATWLLMTLTYWPTLRFYRLSPLWAPLLPLIAAFYLGATIYSAVQYWAGEGGLWKGRIQDLAGN
ncbi:MAG TPA: glycosyltransferase [Terriglobales bacterium]|nr:glycosyltransferase [Terriglobales bacterium]